jgi:thiamine biosynthesis lipoprotein
MANRRPVILLSTFMVVMVLLSGCATRRADSTSTGTSGTSGGLRRFEYTRLCMGVTTRIVLFSSSETEAFDAAAAAFDRIGQLDAIMSDYRRDSELNRLCEHPANEPVRVSDDLFSVIQSSLASSRCSHGAFDITVGPLVALWRTARQTHALPSENELSTARERVGWQYVQLNEHDHTVTLLKPRMQLDLGGIGKGCAAQQAVDLLKSRGISQCMLALAGDIAVGDAPPDMDGWRIEIGDRVPRLGPPGLAVDGARSDSVTSNDSSHYGNGQITLLSLTNAAISTSGDASQFIDINGVRYSHIIDPRTGLGVTNQIQVTVIAPRGEIADALSSAGCVIGTTEGIASLIHQFPGTAAIIEEDRAGDVGPAIIDPTQRIHWSD